MKKPIIDLNNIEKYYKNFTNNFNKLFFYLSSNEKFCSKNFVLKDISFKAYPGDAIGILGKNGAGKSTLLKIISNIVTPSSGSIIINGKVSSILELGLGFHNDFTGRQNIYYIANMMGVRKSTIKSTIDDVVNFADIPDYIDLPVRTYSSGMLARLAFSIATMIRPDILIVDEALSVGDISFQRKCFLKIQSLINDGTTLLFVSHDLEVVKRFCNKALLLDDGKIKQYADSKSVCESYETLLFGVNHKAIVKNDSEKVSLKSSFDSSLITRPNDIYGDGSVEINFLGFKDKMKQKINTFQCKEKFSLSYEVKFLKDVKDPIFGFMIKTIEGIQVFGTNTEEIMESKKKYLKGDSYVVDFFLENCLLPGNYFVNCGVFSYKDGKPIYCQRLVDVGLLQVKGDGNFHGIGIVNLDCDFRIENLKI